MLTRPATWVNWPLIILKQAWQRSLAKLFLVVANWSTCATETAPSTASDTIARHFRCASALSWVSRKP
jgi:hypothetical protein